MYVCRVLQHVQHGERSNIAHKNQVYILVFYLTIQHGYVRACVSHV